MDARSLSLTRPFIAADTETTGLAPDEGARIVEVAFLRFEKDKVAERFVSLVNPGQPIPAEATEIHGITDEMVSEAPVFGAILPGIVSFIGPEPLVFHNCGFDLGFLRAEARRAGMVWPEGLRVHDSRDMALQSDRFPDAVSFSLEALVRRIGVAGDDPFHRAEADAFAVGQLVLYLLKHTRPAGRYRARPWPRGKGESLGT